MKRKTIESGFDVDSPTKNRGSASKRARIDETADANTLKAGASQRSDVDNTLDVSASKQKRRGRPPKNHIAGPGQTPTKAERAPHHVNLTNPRKENLEGGGDVETPLVRNSDRSARKKSARRMIERTTIMNGSDVEDMGEDEDLTQRMLADACTDESTDEHASDVEQEQAIPADLETPSKRPRGRPKIRRKQRTPSPSRDLPPYEHYFFQNRPGGAKTSNNTLSGFSFLPHEAYFDKISSHIDAHESEVLFLQDLHCRAFEKWTFELEQEFNLCFYGWGSKRILLEKFAAHMCEIDAKSKIIVVNGYNPGLTSRDVLTTIASTMSCLKSSSQKLGSQPMDMLNTILTALAGSPPSAPIFLLVNSIDSPSLRRPATQAILARLASSPLIRLVATADTPNFLLLWDASLCAQFKWLFHDVTTFRPFDVELASRGGGGGVVDEVNSLLGRSGRKMQGREGVMYVLRSLTENARSLYALLVAELLSADEEDGMGMGSEVDEEDTAPAISKRSKLQEAIGLARGGIDFRTLYQKATLQFIATNETTFRGLLREFYDHEMIVSRKDGLGGEVFGVPFRKEEMAAILEELAMGGNVM